MAVIADSDCHLGFEVLDLQLDHDEAAQPQVIEEKVEVVVLAADLDMMTAPPAGSARRL
jgi:hypothetical protein